MTDDVVSNGDERLARLGEHLGALVTATDTATRRAADPVAFVHTFDDPRDQEVAAVFSALLAFGRVAAFRPVLARLMAVARAHGGPARWVRTPPQAWLPDVLPLVYRWNRGPDFALLAVALGAMLEGGGSLERHLPGEGTLTEALGALSGAVRRAAVRGSSSVGPAYATVESLPRSFRTLVPDAADGSACKRWWMFLRWMIRPAGDGVDLGLWRSRHPRELVVPLDTHVARIGRLVGLTRRSDGSARTAREITASLRRIDADDPVRFDFALAHLGIAGTCRSVYDPEVCPTCPLRPVCVAGGYGETEVPG